MISTQGGIVCAHHATGRETRIPTGLDCVDMDIHQDILYVVNYTAHTLISVDPHDHTIRNKIVLGLYPRHVYFKGPLAFIVHKPVTILGLDRMSITVIDLTTASIVTELETDFYLCTLYFTDTHLLLSANPDDRLHVYKLSPFEKGDDILFPGMHFISVRHGHLLYSLIEKSTGLHLVITDLLTLKITHDVYPHDNSSHLNVTGDHVFLHHDESIAVLDRTSHHQHLKIKTDFTTQTTFHVGDQLFVETRDHRLCIFDLKTLTHLATLPIQGLIYAFHVHQGFLYLSFHKGQTLSVIDLKQLTLITSVPCPHTHPMLNHTETHLYANGQKLLPLFSPQ